MIDKVPRELRPDQKQALRILARHAVLQLELRRRTQDVRSGGRQWPRRRRPQCLNKSLS